MVRMFAKGTGSNRPTAEESAWPFGDFVFSWDYDMFADTSKTRRAGFHSYVDTERMFYRLFDEFRRNKVIPPR
jgi:hypothetical protein